MVAPTASTKFTRRGTSFTVDTGMVAPMSFSLLRMALFSIFTSLWSYSSNSSACTTVLSAPVISSRTLA